MAWFACVRVYVTGMSTAKTAEPIEMPCGMWAQVDPTNHVVDGWSGSPKVNGLFWGQANMGMPVVGLQRGLDLAREMGIFGKASGMRESAR